MTVADADGHNSAKRIKIPPPVLVEDVLAFALDDHQWSFVIEEYSGIQKLATATAALLPRMARDTAAAENRKAVSQVRASFRAPNVSFTFSKPAIVATHTIILSSALVSACNRVSGSA